MSHASHLRSLFREGILEEFLRYVPKEVQDHPVVLYVGTGISGIVAVAMLKQAGCVRHIAFARKEDEDRHSVLTIEHDIGGADSTHQLCKVPWVFVDDFICSGTTVRRVMQDMLDLQAGPPVGGFLYGCVNDDCWRPRKRMSYFMPDSYDADSEDNCWPD